MLPAPAVRNGAVSTDACVFVDRRFIATTKSIAMSCAAPVVNGRIDVAAVVTSAEIEAFDVAVTEIAPEAWTEEPEIEAIVTAGFSVPIEVPAIASTRLKRMFCASQPIELNASVMPMARLGELTIVL